MAAAVVVAVVVVVVLVEVAAVLVCGPTGRVFGRNIFRGAAATPWPSQLAASRGRQSRALALTNSSPPATRPVGSGAWVYTHDAARPSAVLHIVY